MLFLFIFLLFFNACSQAEVYYVTSDREDCSNCHTLSYYAHVSQWPEDVTLIFHKGEHKLKEKPFILSGLQSVILNGQTSDESLSNPVISCEGSGKQNGIIISNISRIVIVKHLSINCKNGILLQNVTNLAMTNTEAQRLNVNISKNVSISQSAFIAWENDASSFYNYAALIKNASRVMMKDIAMSNKYGGGLALQNNTDAILIDNITVTNTTSEGLLVAWNGNATTLKNINLSNNNKGGLLAKYNGHNILLHNVTIMNSYPRGLLMRCNGNNITLNRIRLDKNRSFGIVLQRNGNYTSLTNVKVTNSQSEAIFIADHGNNITLTNISIGSNVCGIRITFNGNNIALNNVTVNNTGMRPLLVRQNGFSVTLNNVTSTNSYEKGLVLDKNKHAITLNNVIISNNSENGLKMDDNGDNIRLNNVTVVNNDRGVELTHNHNLVIISNLKSISNANSGMYLEGNMNVTFAYHPSTLFNNSSPSNGGGMWIGKDVLIFSGTTINFYNNTARGAGGAIYVDSYATNWMERDIVNCTFINLTSNFRGNYGGVAGNDIYGGKYKDCGNSFLPIFNFMGAINCEGLKEFYNTQKPVSSHVTSSPIGVCQCTTDPALTDCNSRMINAKLYSGQSITISMLTVGLCGGISPGQIVVSNTNSMQVVLNDTNQETKKYCKNFTYQLLQHSTHASNELMTLQHKLIPDKETKFLAQSELNINITFLPCPLGLDLITKRCRCNDVIESINGTECNVDWMPRPIKRYGNNWLHYSTENECTIAHSACPFDYCDASIVYLSLNESDSQCTSNRSGILCGQCKKGFSLMLGSNKCATCTNNYISLLIVFLIAGIVLVVFLLMSNLTVSVGSINGLLFYANILKLNQTVLFPNGASIPVLSQFIAWINLDLGIETCFFNGLDGYWKTWLQFIFPVYIWLLIALIITGSHYSGRVSRLCGNNAVPVLATLILMSYSKLLQAITNVLMMTALKCNSVFHWNVWSVDGNIGYLSGKHIPLFVVAVLFLFVGLVYTGLVFSGQWLQRYSGKCCKSSRDPVVKLKPFIDAYTGPYKNEYRFWTGLLLIVRLLLTPIFSYTTSSLSILNNYIIVLIMTIIMIAMRNVHRKTQVNILEYFHFFNLCILSLVSAVCKDLGLSPHYIAITTGASTSLAMMMFIVTILAHIYLKLFASKKILNRRESSKPLIDITVVEDRDESETAEGSPARIIMRRESLIFDFQR